MGSGMDKFLSFMKLNDSEYEVEDEFEEFDDDDDIEEDFDDEEPVRKKASKSRKSSANNRKNADDLFDDMDEDDSDRGGFFKRSSSLGSSRFRRGNKVVQMHGRAGRGGMEVCVIKPVDFESYCQEISDVILENKAAIINFEDVRRASDAQRIIDFVSGACYAIDGTVKQIAENIVVVAPNDIDVSGDFLDEHAETGVDVPGFVDDTDEPGYRQTYEV